MPERKTGLAPAQRKERDIQERVDRMQYVSPRQQTPPKGKTAVFSQKVEGQM